MGIIILQFNTLYQCEFNTLSSMRYLAVLIIAILAQKSSAHKSCCVNPTLDVPGLLLKFQNIIAAIMVPTLEFGDRSAAKFKNATADAIGNYGFSLLDNMESDASYAADGLIHDIQRDCYILKDLIQSKATNYTKPHCVENVLKKVTNHLKRFLDLKPGISKFELPELPSLPEQQIEVVNRTTRRTAEEMFSHNELTVFSVGTQMYAYSTYIHLHAIHNLLGVFETIRTYFYDKILNCRVLGNYTQVVEEIFENQNFVRSNVDLRIWKGFEEAGYRVIKASENYCESLRDDEEDHNYSSSDS